MQSGKSPRTRLGAWILILTSLSKTRKTILVNCPRSGSTLVMLLILGILDAMSPNSINTVTWRLSVCTLIVRVAVGQTHAPFLTLVPGMRQLSKFASVQDRLREWNPDVMRKIQTYSCLAIEALDIDAIRVDKSTQVTVDALANWATNTRACAVAVGKKNFFITGEVTGGDTFGSLYLGRGRTPAIRPTDFMAAATITSSQNALFLRDAPRNALDGVAFHYSIYRSLTRFLGMDGNLQAAYDVDTNFITAWNQMFVDNDMLNPLTNHVDPRHMYGVSNFDVYRWPSLANGTQRQQLGTFITSLVMPGIPLVR